MRKESIFLLIFVAMNGMLIAKPRSKTEMIQAAAKAIDGLSTGVVTRAANSYSELMTKGDLSLIGQEGGPFAIVTADDSFPEVIGISVAGYRTDNPGLQWYLGAADEALKAVRLTGGELRRIAPDPARFPTHVAPMLQTHWGQGKPYKDQCPRGSDGDNLVTGCVATSMSQVLAYHKLPLHGQGERTIYYPKNDPTGQKLYANFGRTVYDYEHMIDNYVKNMDSYTPEQAQAVSTLMLHCGVATDMQYGETGSGAFYVDAAEGLRDYFGFKNVRAVSRSSYSDASWMELIYAELSAGFPILYGGGNGSYGHSFVLHGYREDGFVYVNWGWDGDADGYYDIDILKPRSNEGGFVNNQGMVIGFRTYQPDVDALTVSVKSPGTLGQLLDASKTYGRIKVQGQINGTDLKVLRERINSTRDPSFLFSADTYSLDLSEAEFVPGGDTFLTVGKTGYKITKNNELPAMAFYGCSNLRQLILPKKIDAIGAGAFGGCEALTSLEGQGQDYVCDDNFVFNGDRTRLIAVLADAIGTVTIPEGVTSIGDYAFTSLRGATRIDLPATLTNIGTSVFTDSPVLTELYIRASVPPKLDNRNVFSILTSSTTLYVHAPDLDTYKKTTRYNSFSSIRAFGTVIRATDATRRMGEKNPKFGFTADGDPIIGEPELVCEATTTSPVGVYVIQCLPGTVMGEDITYVNGKLYVTEATVISVLTGDSHPFDIYSTDGRLLHRNVTTLQGLTKGMYIVGGAKLIVK